MQSKTLISKLLIVACYVGVGAVVTPVVVGPSDYVFAADKGSSDAQLAAKVKGQLKGKNFQDVTALAYGGTVTLSGQVPLYGYKPQAVKKAKKTPGVQAVRDNIAVGGPTLPDNVLQRKLMEQIQVDRVGYGQVFNAIGAAVQNGVVTLVGHAVGPVAAQSAVSLTEFTPGVKDVINQIRIDPAFADGRRNSHCDFQGDLWLSATAEIRHCSTASDSNFRTEWQRNFVRDGRQRNGQATRIHARKTGTECFPRY